MATTTTYLGLTKPAETDAQDIAIINANMDKIDKAVKTAFQGRAAHNWLGNSYFRIAQAGYGGMHGTQKYACDRWYDTYGFGSFSFDESQGLTIACWTNHAYLVQKINGASLLHGKTVTLAIQLSDGTVYVKSGVFNSSGASFQIVVDNGKTFTLYYDRAEFVVTSGSLTVKWAALYEGSYTADTLPACQSKGYAAELAECQMYFERLGVEGSETLGTVAFAKSGAKSVIISMQYQPKRVGKPTLVFGDVSKYRLLLMDAVNASGFSANQISIFDEITVQSPFASVRVTMPNPLDRDCWVRLQRVDNSDGAYIDVDADL